MVVKERNGWVVRSETGKTLSRPYPSKEQAKERLGVIEYFKRKKIAKELKKVDPGQNGE